MFKFSLGTSQNCGVSEKRSYVKMETKILFSGVQRSAKVFVRGCEKFVTALAYLFCLAVAGSCLARFAYFFADLCKSQRH